MNWKPCVATGRSSPRVLGCWKWWFSKADLWLADYYDQRLVAKTLWPLGKELRDLLEEDIKVVLAIANDSHLMADLPWIAESIQLRNVYTDPLNVLQAELLYRSRLTGRAGQIARSSRRTGVDGHDCGRRRRYAQHRLTPKESRPHAVMWGAA
ncbi:phosphoenolpyruvate carboxylase [Salmonella enterica subsp. arizonae]|uniref:Phosphoenolpyruvate carboxylase n=1 Tax=Salmonella enterica subsp. arizonae TaxID=59203 RepID=A0A379TML4_SALER|nr:phosphoenolpyruvate carboxylase [Salmonella enterica subsp. arizonae]